MITDHFNSAEQRIAKALGNLQNFSDSTLGPIYGGSTVPDLLHPDSQILGDLVSHAQRLAEASSQLVPAMDSGEAAIHGIWIAMVRCIDERHKREN